MSTIEIYDRSTGEVVRTVPDMELRSFLIYWTSQGNDLDYGWREVEPDHGSLEQEPPR